MKKLIKLPMYQEDLAKVINHTPQIKQLHGNSVLLRGAAGMFGSFMIDTLMA
ncbi:SDR family NAD-dependent epimerase/dehydratase, partial [Enterococcus faecium]